MVPSPCARAHGWQRCGRHQGARSTGIAWRCDPQPSSITSSALPDGSSPSGSSPPVGVLDRAPAAAATSPSSTPAPSVPTSSSVSALPDRTVGYLSLSFVPLLWGTYNPCIRFLYAEPEPLDPASLTAVRTVLSAGALLLPALVGYLVKESREAWRRHQQRQFGGDGGTDRTGPSLGAQPPPLGAALAAATDGAADGVAAAAAADEVVAGGAGSESSPPPRGLLAEPVNSARLGPVMTRTFDSVILGGLELGLLNFLGTALQVEGLHSTSATRAGFLAEVTAVLTPLVSYLAGYEIPRQMWLAVAVGLVGSTMVAYDTSQAQKAQPAPASPSSSAAPEPGPAAAATTAPAAAAAPAADAGVPLTSHDAACTKVSPASCTGTSDALAAAAPVAAEAGVSLGARGATEPQPGLLVTGDMSGLDDAGDLATRPPVLTAASASAVAPEDVASASCFPNAIDAASSDAASSADAAASAAVAAAPGNGFAAATAIAPLEAVNAAAITAAITDGPDVSSAAAAAAAEAATAALVAEASTLTSPAAAVAAVADDAATAALEAAASAAAGVASSVLAAAADVTSSASSTADAGGASLPSVVNSALEAVGAAAESAAAATAATATALDAAAAIAATATAASGAATPLAPTGGEAYLLLACLFYSICTVRMGIYAPRMDTVGLAAMKKVGLSSMSVLWMATTNLQNGVAPGSVLAFPDLASRTPTSIAVLMYSGLGPGALATYLQVTGLSTVPATTAQVIYSMTPLCTAFFAYLILGGEATGPVAWAGGSLIIFAALMAADAQQKQHQQQLQLQQQEQQQQLQQ